MFNTKSKVLVVDDMSTMRKIISKILKELEFTDISEAVDGEDAWMKALEANPPFDLIISDWNMPNCSGLDFLKRVRAHDKLKKTPFLLVTAESEQQQVLEAVSSGVDQYIVKPFSKESLKQKLEIAYKRVAKRIGA